MDSSSDDEGAYTTTNVTLGYASQDASGDEISHIGGHPTWLNDRTPPPVSFSKCKSCTGFTSLLLQLNADLQSHFPNDDRRIHVFCCRKKTCSRKIGSVRAFREVRKPAERPKPSLQSSPKESQNPSQGLGTVLFGASGPTDGSSNANPFSKLNSNAKRPENPFSSLAPAASLAAMPPQRPADEPEPPLPTFAEKLRISDQSPPAHEPQHEPWPDRTSFPSPFPQYFLDADGEDLEPEKPAPSSMSESSNTQYDVEDAAANSTGKDSFESSLDKTFQKFSDRVAQNPEQILRYEFKGQPLLYSGNDDVANRFIVPHGKAGAARGMPRCESCGAQRVFELQLVPGLIYELEKDESTDLDDGMDWGTIIVGTCVNNCGDAGLISFREEWVGVQWEERVIKK